VVEIIDFTLERRAIMPNFIRVAVIDDHPLFRSGAVGMLASAGGIEVVGEGATAADALKVAKELTPDVMLLDVNLPGGGIEAAASIAGACPDVRTLMLTASEDDKDVALALEAGARGYILKGSSGPEVVEAVRAIGKGECYVAPNLAARLLMKHQRTQIEIVEDDNPHDLTSREAGVFALVAQGMSNKEIARSFKCTDRTVKHHMTNIMQKLNVRNRVEAALKFRPGSLDARPVDVPQSVQRSTVSLLNQSLV
jgi:two-component system, NarL family, nitrate/nitrite response regulator NarL